MIVTVDVELGDDELAQLYLLSGKAFMTAGEMADAFSGIIHRELRPGVDVGFLFRATYYREDPAGLHGYRMYQHSFMGPHWPHVDGRPRLYFDGEQLRSRGGAFTVDAVRGIVDNARENVR